MTVDSGLKRGPVADVFCDSCFESTQGRGGFYYLNELAVWFACQNKITRFFYKLMAKKRAVLLLAQRDNHQQALLLCCSPRSWFLRLFGGNFRLGWISISP
jgi:hypothetical protein